jgi:Protein of unknown function (DUF3540)
MAYIDPQTRRSGERKVPIAKTNTTLQIATLTAVLSDHFVLETASESVVAQRAVSCLLAPSIGDECLCSITTGSSVDTAWIISVLSRTATHQAELRLPQNVRVVSPQGHIAFEATSLSMTSEQMRLKADEACVTFTSASVASKTARFTVGTLKTVASYVSLVADRVLHYSQSYSRTTAGLDRTEAPHIEITAQQLLKLKGEYTLVEGEHLVKARGAQIHFG